MLKKRITKEDGRYLIYYSFPDGAPKYAGEPTSGKEKAKPRGTRAKTGRRRRV